jgi:NB-ARC domain/APAF-1 helical domain
MQQDNRDNSTGIQVDAKDNSKVNVAKTINIYESSQPPRGIPFQALALPKDYVDRPEIRQKIKSKLIDCSVSRPGTLVVSAIYGLGGAGKSVMAAALAHDQEVQEVCVDGVLWVTLGQNPDLLSSLYAWVQKLGDYDFKPTNVDSASSHLRSLLHDKKMLLVVDDAWQTDHVVPFQVGGDGCRVLVTTREAEVLDADRIDMDVMSEAEALELLLSKAQVKSLTIEDKQQAKKLIAVVGGLPLAVDLAGAQIADGMSWSELLEDLEAEIAYLEALDRPNFEGVRDEKTRKRLSLKASLNLSLKLLSSERLQQFAWLGVLPEDVAIQPEMAATLWSISRKKAGEVLRTFRAKALLLSGVQGLGQESSYRIHDLMHDLARGLLTGEGEKEIPGLGLQWSDAHGILLDRYRQQAMDNLLHTLPDDGYIYSYLTWHMEKATRFNELHELFQEVTTEGHNGWYERCDFLGLNAKFVTDLARAWKLAEEMYGENAGESIGLQIRYALIFSTLNSLASNIPAELIAALVKYKKWSPAQGLAYAKQSQESSKRVAIIKELAAFLPQFLLSEALEIARGIQDDFSRAGALSKLASHLPDIASEALEVARGIQDDFSRASALSRLASHLPDIASEALEVARSIQDEFDRANALIRLAPHLPKNLLSEALEVARGIQSESSRANALSGLAPYLPDIVSEALEVARSIQSEFSRASALSGLASYLPDIVSEALEVARGIQNDFSRASALSGLAPYLPDIVSEALEVARVIQSESHRASALSRLAPHLPNIVLEALEIVRGIQDDSHRAYALRRLVPHLPENLLPEALKVVRGIQSEFSRASALSGLAPHLPENLLSEALEVVRGIQDDSSRASALTRLASHLPNIVLEALEVVRGIQDDSSRASVLSKLAPYLLDNLLSEALEVARGIQDDSSRADVLSGLFPHLPDITLEALEIVRGIQDDSSRASALTRLASHLPDIASEALEVARGIQDDSSRANALSRLAPHLPKNLLSEALEVVRGIQDDSSRAYALSWLAPHLPDIVSETLEASSSIQDEFSRAGALSRLAPHLPENLLSNALEVARGIQSEFSRAYLLSRLAPHLPDIALEALEVVRGIQDDSSRAYALRGLAPHLPDIACEALEVVRSIQDEFSRADALSWSAPYLLESLLSEALEVARGIQDDSFRAYALRGLVPHLPENLLSEALEVARGIQDEFSRANALSGLAPHINLKFFNFPFWSEMLHTLSNRDRSQLLQDIPKLAPAIIHLSDRSTLNLVVQAMREVCQQWP